VVVVVGGTSSLPARAGICSQLIAFGTLATRFFIPYLPSEAELVTRYLTESAKLGTSDYRPHRIIWTAAQLASARRIRFGRIDVGGYSLFQILPEGSSILNRRARELREEMGEIHVMFDPLRGFQDSYQPESGLLFLPVVEFLYGMNSISLEATIQTARLDYRVREKHYGHPVGGWILDKRRVKNEGHSGDLRALQPLAPLQGRSYLLEIFASAHRHEIERSTERLPVMLRTASSFCGESLEIFRPLRKQLIKIWNEFDDAETEMTTIGPIERYFRDYAPKAIDPAEIHKRYRKTRWLLVETPGYALYLPAPLGGPTELWNGETSVRQLGELASMLVEHFEQTQRTVDALANGNKRISVEQVFRLFNEPANFIRQY